MSAHRSVFVLMLTLTGIGATVLFAAFSLRSPSGSARSGSMLVFDVPFELEEGDAPARPLSLDFARRRHFVHDVVTGLRRAALDDHVRGLVLHIDDLDWGWAKTLEVRDAIQRFRETGKPVYASIVSGGDLEYLLASAADVVAIAPAAVLQLNGLSASAMFLRGALDKLDVRPNYVRAGSYKSAVEEYTRSEMSAEAREAIDAVLDDTYAVLVDSIAASRDYEPGDVRRMLDAGPFTANDARAAGLIDTVLYDAEMDSLALDNQTGDVTTFSFARYSQHRNAPHGRQRIALINAAGTMLPGRSHDAPGGDLVLGAETMIEALSEARTRASIKAVVLRIDSPGGAIDAADDIWREVKRLSQEKPVIVSMSDVAASGGFYIATPAQRIVAHPATLTGSIGVYGGKLNVLGLLRKLGVNVETVARGVHAEMLSPYRDFTDEERARYQQQIDASYRLFLSRVVEGRGLTWAEAEAAGRGRVWSGTDAQQLGLVDTLGDLETAVSLAKRSAGMDEDETPAIEVLPKVDHPWYESLFDELFASNDEAQSAERLLLPPLLRAWITAARLQAGTSFALMPFSLEIR